MSKEEALLELPKLKGNEVYHHQYLILKNGKLELTVWVSNPEIEPFIYEQWQAERMGLA